jgi:hypothetical protein
VVDKRRIQGQNQIILQFSKEVGSVETNRLIIMPLLHLMIVPVVMLKQVALD